MRWLAVCLILLTVVVGCAAAPADPKPSVSPVRVRALAVASEVTVASGDFRRTAFLLFENTSDQPVRYFRQEDECGLGLGKMNIFAGDKLAGNRAVWERKEPLNEQIRELKPGEGAVVYVPLNRLYQEGEPGRYTLRVSYDVPAGGTDATESGLTPMSWKLRVPLVYK